MNEKPPPLNYERPRPPKPWLSQAERESWQMMLGCAGAILGFVSLPALFFVTCNLAFKLMQRVVISLAFGADRYAAGVRIVGKKGVRLSDGTPLPWGWELAFVLGVFFCVVLVLAPYHRLLQKLGLLRDDDAPQKTQDS